MADLAFLSPDYPIDRLTAVLENSQACSRPVAGGEGFTGFIQTPGSILTESDRLLMTEFMRGELDGEDVIINMRGSDGGLIAFESADDARLTASRQIPNLGKQLLFSIYRKTGIKFSFGAQTIQP